MDPDAALKELREIMPETRGYIYDIDRIRELFEGLDGWLSKGGFLPTDWERD